MLQISKFFFTIIALCFTFHIYARQCDEVKSDAVDSFAKTVEYSNDIFVLTKNLTEQYSEPIKKLRSIFIWITENIKYDYESVNKEKEIAAPECSGGADCEVIFREWETRYLNGVLKNKKAICDGYSRLLKRMCEIADIKCEMVSGYLKTEPYQIGSSLSVNHSWNAVYIDSNYYFVDATWAAGFCIRDEETDKLTKYIKCYDNYYWFTPFLKLSRNHFPENGRWVQDRNYTKEKFAANPYYASDILSQIDLQSPASGIISAKKGDTVHFRFSYTGAVEFIQLNTNISSSPSIFDEEKISKHKKQLVIDSFALSRQKYIAYNRTGNEYSFDYIVTDNALSFINVLFDYRRVMRFIVKIRQ